MFFLITLIGLLAGLLIGTIGIGGVILAPLLSFVLGFDLHLAMSASSFSFLFPGIVGTVTYAQKRSIVWQMVLWLTVGIVPAALLGARFNVHLNTAVLTIIIALLITFSGINVFINRQNEREEIPEFSKLSLIFMGAVVGFGSSLTGTGGPVLLVPILVTLHYPALKSIGISQAIQLPIALFAVTGFWLFGQIDFELGLHLGITQAIGAYFGAQMAHRLPVVQLRRLVAVALIGVGILMVWQIIG
ncbi:MAG: sulfite exporter TauE/SafE family protein [Chloroflexi bacterium]|nr:sulfite exporter TauE/SafE family protein [Chloroflexota bacterium]